MECFEGGNGVWLIFFVTGFGRSAARDVRLVSVMDDVVCTVGCLRMMYRDVEL